jgi:NADP-reducing hydrogenase subunit HndB
MARLTGEGLNNLKEKIRKESALSKEGFSVKITVYLGTCGIAAGGDRVFEALEEEMGSSGRKDIKIVISGCAGMCSSEPNVMVGRVGEDAVLYRDLNAEKMRRIFRGHVLEGEVQSDYAMAKIKWSEEQGEGVHA